MSIEGQGHFFTIYFPGFVCFMLYKAKISGERLQDHWSSGFIVALPEPSINYYKYSPRAGAKKMMGKFYFINKTLCCPPPQLNDFVTVFPHSIVYIGSPI